MSQRQLKDWGVIAANPSASISVRVWSHDQTILGVFTVTVPQTATKISDCTWSGAGWLDTYFGAEVLSITNGTVYAAPVDDITKLTAVSGEALVAAFGMGVTGSVPGQSAAQAFGSSGGGGITNISQTVAMDGGSFSLTNAMQTVVTQGGTQSPQLSLGAGTWLVYALVSFTNGATAGDGYQGEIYNVTDSAIVGVAAGTPTQFNASAAGQLAIPMFLQEVITLAATKTIGIRARNVSASRGSVSAGRTHIGAVQLA